MGQRLQQFGLRVSEANKLAADMPSCFNYLLAHYYSRIAERIWLPTIRARIVSVHVAGRTLRAAVRANGADWCVLRGVFLDREYEFYPARPVRRVLDLGANCGYATMFFSAIYPDARVVAVEPVPWNVEACRRNMMLNGLGVDLVEAAVACEDGSADLLLTDNDSCQSLVPVHNWKSRLRVKTFSVPTLMEMHNWDYVDVLKVDIEGYEAELFRGGPNWLSSVGTIVCELHGAYGPYDLRRDLTPHGFAVKQLSDGYEKTTLAVRQS